MKNTCDIHCKIADGIEISSLFLSTEDDYEELDDTDRQIMLDYFFTEQKVYNTSPTLSDTKFNERLEEILKEMHDQHLDEYWDNINEL